MLRAKCDTHLEIAPCAERPSRMRNYRSSSNAEISALKKAYEGLGLGFGVLGFYTRVAVCSRVSRSSAEGGVRAIMVLSFAKLAPCSNAAVAQQQQQQLSVPVSSPSLVLHCTACGDSDAARRHTTRLSTEDVPLRSFQNWKMLAWSMPHHRGITSRAGGCVNLRNWQLRCLDPSQEEERAEASGEGIVQQPRSERVQQQGVDGFQRAKLAVFLSGGGSNFRALHAATLQNAIYGDVVVVVSDRPGMYSFFLCFFRLIFCSSFRF